MEFQIQEQPARQIFQVPRSGNRLYLIGTSEHSMIGKFIDQVVDEEELPQTMTSYSPCFRKEKGAHGIEERGVYRHCSES